MCSDLHRIIDGFALEDRKARENGRAVFSALKIADFDEVMESIVGSGSKVDINNVTVVKREKEENGKTQIYYTYEEVGKAAKSSTNATTFIAEVGNKNTASSSNEATLNSADSLKVADTISKEQRSSLFYMFLHIA